RIKGAGGGGSLLAQFTPEEWSRREPAYRLLADAPMDIVRWVAHESGHTARQGPMEKVFDGGVVFYARHGRAEGPDRERMRKNLDLGSAEHVMLLESGKDNVDAESSILSEERAERNRRLARELDKTVWWPQAEVAVMPSPDGSSAQIHLREDADGKRTTLLYSVKGAPTQYAFQGMLMPEPVPEGTRYPRAADWNSGNPHVRRPVTDRHGRWIGEAVFDQADHELRAPALRQAAGITEYTQWERTSSGGVSGVQRTMPVTDGSSAYWFGHGDPTADMAEFGRFADRVVESGLTSITVVACSTRSGVAASAGRLRPLVERNRLAVHLVPARIALVPGREGRPGRMHVDVDRRGRPAGFVSLLPGVPDPVSARGARVGQESVSSRHYPQDVYWNAPARIKAVEPRFPHLYAPDPSGGRNRYEELSREYEVALRKVYSVHEPVHFEMVDTLKALFDYYEPHFHGETYKLFASRQRPESAKKQFTRLTDDNSDATLDERMDAFADAVFGNPDHPGALGKLWGKKPELKPDGLSGLPDPTIPYSAEVLDRARAYGYWFAAEPPEVVTHLMRVRRMLNVPKGEPMLFRDALIGWGLKSHSLAEVLAATQKAGVRDELEPSRPVDAARLYAWSDSQLDPRRAISTVIFASSKSKYGFGSPVWESLRQPHERWFHESWSIFDSETRRALERIADMIGVEGSQPPEVMAGRPAPRRRRALMELWERQGLITGVLNLRAGHLLGLYLVLGPDRHLIKVRPTGSKVFSQGEATPPLPEPTARELVVEAWEKKGGYPALFRTDPAFRQRLAMAEARRDGRSEEELRVWRDELIELAVEWTERHAPAFSGYEELASEAVELLIPAHQRAWFGEWAAGPVDGPHTFGNAKGVIRKEPLHSVSLNRSALLDGLLASDEDHTGKHLVLYEVGNTSAREVAPFLPTVRHTDRGKALYPGVVAFTYRGYRIERDERSGRSYVVVTLTENLQPLSPEAWDREFQNRTMRNPDGAQIGTALIGSNDSAHGSMVKVTDSSTYRTYHGVFKYSDQEHPVPWQPGQVGWLSVHGSGTDLTTPSRYGAKRVSGAQVGAFARQLLRSFGSPDIPFVLAACSAGQSHAVGTVVAQAVADWSERDNFAGPTVLAFPNPKYPAESESGKTIRNPFFGLKTTLDNPAPRFTRFEPRPLIDPVRPETLAEQGAWTESLYSLQEWAVHARDHEIALAEKLARDPETLDAAVHALEAAGGKPRAKADVTEVMVEFFEKALPQEMLQVFSGILPRIGSFTDEQLLRGVRITRKKVSLPQMVFQEYANLASPTYPQLLAFRKAVVAWLVGSNMSYAHSLHEVLLGSQLSQSGFDHMDRIFLAGDAAHLYMWADQHLGPDGGTTPVGLALPME
ncbi:hypothetical protein, partial [Streptomyces sp. NPDC093109]|uniref:hypothetical protein n=1 Tax=Streptomyces sp. NPDC093109 TaxID=3154977 RepID=UPI00344EFB37